MNNFYIYYHCDQWKMRNSMSVVGVFQEEKLKRIIIEDLLKGDIELDGKTEEEILSMNISTIQNLINFAHLEPITLNARC